MTDNNPLLNGAIWYASQGWKIHVCHGVLESGLCTCGEAHNDPKDIGKHPATRNGQSDATTDPNTIASWFTTQPRYNLGVACKPSGFFVIDVDPRSGGFESFQRFEELVEGEIPKTVTAITGAYNVRNLGAVRGRHLFFKIPENESLVGKIDGLPGVDIKHNGYVLLYPSNHVSGVTYEWAEGCAPWEIPMAEPSEKMMELLRKRKGRSSGSGSASWSFVDDLEWGGDKLDLEKFLNEGIDEGSRAIDIYAMTCSIANRYANLDELDRKNIETMMIRFNFEMVRPPLELDGPNGLLHHVHRAIDFVAANPKNELNKKIAGLGDTYLRNVGGPASTSVVPVRPAESDTWNKAWGPTSVNTSDPDDYQGSDEFLLDVNLSKDSDALSEDDGGVEGGRTLTDTGNGRRLVDVFGSTIRYTPGLGWFHWNGDYWKPDTEDLEVRELSKRLASVIGAEGAAQDDSDVQKAFYKWATQAKSNARQASAIESAQSDPRVGVPVDHWDNNPYLIGVANGVIDLRTGELHRGRPDLHITRRAPVAYSPSFTSPRFQTFLDEATYGDKEYQEWLQKVFGYTLTGLRTYDHMYLMYGPAGSGKNVMVESLVKLMGTKQYAFPMDSTVLAQNDGRANTSDQYYWAELRGRRMVWVDELPESERLKENSVKKLTGSSEISARSPGEKPFTFESQAKLWITTNHRPIITDDAMWRRIRPIPWMNVPTNPDPTLKAYLHDPEGGLPAVLSWAVEGAIKLLNSKEPDAIGWCSVVSNAAEMYRKNEDRMGMFLEEETDYDVASSTSIKSLFLVYQKWSEDRGERPMTQIGFTRKLEDRGQQISGTGARAMLMGYKIKATKPESSSGNANDWDFLQRMGRE